MRDLHRIVNEKKIKFVDLKFPDLFGSLQHITLPIETFDEKIFINGLGFDGSSIRGFQHIHESDMLIRPDLETMFIDPFMDDATISFLSNIKEPITHQIYSRDTRAVAQRAERYIEANGIADQAFFGPELEFFIFDEIRFDQKVNRGFYLIDSQEGDWNSGRAEKPNLGYKPRNKGGYFPSPPVDSYQNLRSKMVTVLRAIGVDAELHHHEVASGGQSEIGIRFNTMVNMGDQALKYKYVIKNVAHRFGKTATFMPKPLFQDNGSGMHVHLSLWKDGRNLFYEPGRYAELSPMAIHFIGGLLHHAPALCAICAPTTNSYRRLVPGYEAPINLVYSQRNRSACVRIPMYSGSGKAKRIEFRTPDPSGNPYLVLAAILMAGVDGVLNHIEPPAPIDEDIYELAPEKKQHIRNTPGSLEEALAALRNDHDFLLRGDVFTEDLIRIWLDYKALKEVDYIRLRPHPGEFALYYDA
ncbi:type I glutamate--ammonia ligase [candidate division KSB1 bacterium]|nr:type I glutamate--ammonia ligase [candidate division KSB1 bacterium]